MASTARPLNPRNDNLQLIAQSVFESAKPLTRPELAKLTGLNRSTITRLLEVLLEYGVLQETEDSISIGGRPATLFSLAQRTHVGIGVEVTYHKVNAAIIDLTATELAATTLFRDSDSPTSIVESITSAIADLKQQALEYRLNITGAAIGFAGLYSSDNQRLITAPNFNWSDLDLPEEYCGITAQYFNSASCAANAEARAQKLIGMKDFLYVNGVNGIGAAVVRHGQVSRGIHGWSGELGHMVLNDSNAKCSCGNRGCLQAQVNIDTLIKNANLAPESTINHLLAAAKRDEPNTIRALNDAGELLGRAFANCINLLDIRAIRLAGFFREISPFILPGVYDQVKAHTLAFRERNISIEPAHIGPEATVIGAGLTSLSSYLQTPEDWTVPAGGWNQSITLTQFQETQLTTTTDVTRQSR